MIESTARAKAAAWVEISMPRPEPEKVTLARATTPAFPGFNARPRPCAGEIKVLVVIVRLTLPVDSANAEPIVFVATNTEPRITVPVESDTTAAVEPRT